MFARVFALLPLALLASASHLAARDNYCNTGSSHCCNSASAIGSHQSTLPDIGDVANVAAEVLAAVGVVCTLGIENCASQPVCCSNVNNYGGLINIDCTSISL